MKARLCVAAAGLVVCAGRAEAQLSFQTWVSGVGDDTNPCTSTLPCRSFAGAIAKTTTTGQVNVLDSASYGTVLITKSVTISSEGFEAGVIAVGMSAIVVNSASATVVLRGLDIDGAGLGGHHGINVLAASAVFVENCTIHNFALMGINFVPSGGATLFVKDTIIRNQFNFPTGGGIYAEGHAGGLAKVFLDGVLLERNYIGLLAKDYTLAQVRNSAAIGNGTNGFWALSAGGGAVELSLEHTRASLNGTSGVRAENPAALLRLTHATITNNGILGIQAATGGQVVSFGTNYVDGNPINGTPTATLPPL